MSTINLLKNIRKELGLSQHEISDLLGISRSGWCNCEVGRRRLSVKKCYKLIKIAKLKNIIISLDKLLPE